MKLGDKMTAVEASCGLWEEACPRKTRPPRIGDIPRYTAVDEESPGRLQVLPVSLSVDAVKKSDEMLEFRLQPGVHGDVFSSNQLTTVKKSQNSDNRDVGIAEGRVPAVTVVNEGRFDADDLDKIPEQLESSDPEEVKTRGSLLRICSTPSQEIREVRKDSALYLEEVEGLKDLRESLRSRGSPASRSLAPRRESSGYASNLGTFDDDRRGSETDLGFGSRERRRSSSTKNKLTKNLTENLTQTSSTKAEVHTKSFASLNDRGDSFSIGELPSYAEVLASNKSVTQFTGKLKELRECGVQSFDNSNETPSSSSSSSVEYKKPMIIPSLPSSTTKIKRTIVHQYSTPNFPSIELESISEKCSENNGKFVNDLSVINARSSLPKSVKVYQLLSTQSEDRGDGETPNLVDRRISLQINRQDDIGKDKSVIDEGKGEGFNNETTVYVTGEKEEEQQPSSSSSSSSSSTRHLTPGFPMRKFSTPGEMGGSQRILTGESAIGIRPIYPYCPYSPYGSPQGSPRTRRRPLRESRRVSIDNRQGALQLNQYKLLDNIGQGSYGIVKLAYNEEDETHYAMKILSKKKLMKKAGIFGRMAPGRKGLANPLAKVYREIALLKKLDHPNVVKLVEVLDDPDEDNLYLAFELVQKGEVLQLPTDQPLDEETARTHFRDIVMGVEYLHYQRIVHRDIKPSNLLVDSEGRVKVADLGVSAELRAAGELLSGPAGTPAFAAPETTTPGAEYSGTLCDVWSMGVTLYSLVTGKVPWDGSGSIIGVQAAVRSEPLRFPDEPKLSDPLKDLISRMLKKEPEARLSIAEIKNHPWVTRDGDEILPSEADNCRLPVTVTDEEVARVVTRVPKLDTLILIKTMLKQHSFQNPFLPKRNAKSVSGERVTTEEAATPSSPSVKSKTKDSSTASENTNTRAEKFHEAGRSNSAPDTFECHLSERQGVSLDNQLPPVTEASTQEITDGSNFCKSNFKR